MQSADARSITITTVFDNYAVDPRLDTRWGFAAVIATPATTVLFDTGSDGATLLSNMQRLEINPKEIDKIVISHIHADHIGGLRDFLRTDAKVAVFIPQSFPDQVRRMIEGAGARHQDVIESVGISPGIRTTGPMGTNIQEQALVVETHEGLVVLTGCAHPGVVSVVKAARTMNPNADIALVMGGFHLLADTPSQIDEVVRAFRELGVKRVAPSHCTGDLARNRFQDAYGANYIAGGAGLVLKFAMQNLGNR